MVRREFQSLAHGVKNPAEDELSGAPSSVSLEKLFEGDGFVAMWVVSPRLGQHRVDGVEEVAAQGFELPEATLSYLDEVIHEDVCGANWSLRRLVRRRWGF